MILYLILLVWRCWVNTYAFDISSLIAFRNNYQIPMVTRSQITSGIAEKQSLNPREYAQILRTRRRQKVHR